MTDNEIDACLFAINKKAEEAITKMYSCEDHEVEFWRGQYLAFREVFSLLKNVTQKENEWNK